MVASIGRVSPRSQGAALAPGGGRPGKRRAILAAARRAFLDAGYSATGLDAVAAAAGVSKQTIYNHFGDKRSLFLAVAEEVQAEAGAVQDDDPTPGAGTPGAATVGDLDTDLRQLAHHLVTAALTGDVVALRRVVLAEHGHDPALAEALHRPRSSFERSFAEGIRVRVGLGLLDVDDPEVATRQFLAVTAQQALAGSWYGTRELPAAEVARIVDEGVALWLRAYRVRD